MLIHAEKIITMDGEPIARGSVRTEGSKIVEVGTELEARPNEEVIDLPNHVLLPGLINAHCHLDYTCMKGAMFASQSFPEWIRRINGIKKSLGPDDFLQSIYDGFNELMDTGCTTVLNIEAFPELLNRLEPPPIRTWWFLELIDIRNKLVDDASLLGMLQFFDYKKEWLGGFGLSPHAPYTASVDLYRLAKTAARKLNMLVTTHIAESIEEQSMFLYGEGALYDFLSSLGRDMSDCAQGSALSHLIEFGAIDRNTIAAHLNYLQEYDWEALASTPMHIVHCPKCHAFFGHYRFPLEQLTQVGCNIMLGTDSLASNNKLDLRSEIRQARQFYSEISAREWLEMVTTRPAKAIGMEDKLGIIKKDALADLTAFMLPADSEPHEAVIRSRDVPALLMVDGVVKEGFDIKPVCIS